MALTASYSQIHSALKETAREYSVTPFTARILLAVDELVIDATTDVLEKVLNEPNGAMIRRELQHAYAAGLARGEAVDGGPRRGGCRTLVTLTERGAELASSVQRQVLASSAQKKLGVGS